MSDTVVEYNQVYILGIQVFSYKAIDLCLGPTTAISVSAGCDLHTEARMPRQFCDRLYMLSLDATGLFTQQSERS